MNAANVDGRAVPPGAAVPNRADDTFEHVSVLAEEAVSALCPRPGGVYVDGTFGAGGHSARIAARIVPGGRLLCIDRDPTTQAFFERLPLDASVNAELIIGSYADLPDYLRERGIQGVDGILLDLGLSSLQLDDPERGFSFRFDGPLDMRYDRSRGQTAAALLATAPEPELARIFWEYGEERFARRIARAVVQERERRPLDSSAAFAAFIERVVGGRRGDRIHPATRVFQALRIAVNDELGEVERGIAAGLRVLRVGGRFVVISFHSLEDRIVKRAFAEAARGCICPRDTPVCICGRRPSVRLIGRATRASEAEIAANPRARSAVMRVAERLPEP